MIPAAFDYVRPTSVAEAVAALAAGGEDAKVLAGGQSLMPLAAHAASGSEPARRLQPGRRDARRHATTATPSSSARATTHHEVLHDALVQAARAAGSARRRPPSPTRRSGTAGPSAVRWLTPTRRATCRPWRWRWASTSRLTGPGGSSVRSPPSDFFVDYFTTALAVDEVLVSVRVPKLGDGWGYDYQKFHRTAQAWAIVGVAAAVRRSNGSIAEARVGLTNMGATPLRASSVEAALAGAPATADGVRGGRRARGRGHPPDQRPARAGRLPRAPGARPDPASRHGRRRHLTRRGLLAGDVGGGLVGAQAPPAGVTQAAGRRPLAEDHLSDEVRGDPDCVPGVHPWQLRGER